MNSQRIPAELNKGHSVESCMSYLDFQRQTHKKEGDPRPLRFVCGFPLPEFQRAPSWSEEQKVAFIESAWLGLPLGTFTHHVLDWDSAGNPTKQSGWLIDGQQRLTAVQDYLEDKVRVFGLYYSELTDIEKRRFNKIKFCHYEVELEEGELKRLYNLLAFGGTAHKAHERA